MAVSNKNPFYFLVLAACACLLITMFVYLLGYFFAPLPNGMPRITTPMPGWMKWIDRNAIMLIACEVGCIIVFGILTIGLDGYFPEKRNESNDANEGQK